MPRTRECDYCGADIEPGTGTMFVRTDGTTIHYCSSKCENNASLGREARDLEWTEDEGLEEAEEAEAVGEPTATEEAGAVEDEAEEAQDEAEETEDEADVADEEEDADAADTADEDEDTEDADTVDDDGADEESEEADEEETEAEA